MGGRAHVETHSEGDRHGLVWLRGPIEEAVQASRAQTKVTMI